MKKLIVMMLLAVVMVGCANKKQQYTDNLSQFVNMAARQHIKYTLLVTDSRHGYNTSDYFNDKMRKELADSMTVIDSLYIVLADAPKGFEKATPSLRTIYQDLKKFEDMILVMYQSSPEYNSNTLTIKLDSVGAYNSRFERSLYNLKADVPQAFTNGKAE